MRALSFNSILILIPVILRVSYGGALLFDHELPCEFPESVNLTGGILHTNGSFVFNGIDFTTGQYAQINYTEKDGKSLIVQPYYRGCPCKNKPCIRLCCPYGSFVVNETTDGEFFCRSDGAARRILGEIINENNETKTTNFEQHFEFVDRVCKNHFYAEKFQITHDGHVLSEDGRFHHRNYCLALKQNGTKSSLQPLICFGKRDDFHQSFRILPYVMMTAIPFIIATILVYAFIPELMNSFGKCVVSLLVNLFIFNVTLSYVQLNAGNYVPPTPCKIFAYSIYFSYVSFALWLNVISFNVFQSFRFIIKQRRRSDRQQFIWYCVYVYIMSTILTVASGVIDSIDSLPDHLKPGFGTENCFIKNNRTSMFLYFYLQISIIFCTNIVFFVLTALKIRHLNKDVEIVHRSCFNRKRISYEQYLRLFLLLGITRIVDAMSYIGPEYMVFMISDICNSTQGIVIFILLVLDKRLFLKLKRRFVSFGAKTVQQGTEIKPLN